MFAAYARNRTGSFRSRAVEYGFRPTAVVGDATNRIDRHFGTHHHCPG